MVSAQNTEDPLATCEDEGTGTFWNGVCKPVPFDPAVIPQPIPGFERLQPYAVAFMKEANGSPEVGATRRIGNTEFMVVIVKQGEFALDVGTIDNVGEIGNVVVSSPSGKLAKLTETNVDGVTEFNETGEDFDCVFSCAILPDTPVLLKEGDVAFAKPGAICLWCLLHGKVAGVGTPVAGGVIGGLEVLALLETDDTQSFSWIQSWNTPEEGLASTPTALATGPSAIRALAFNPGGTRCKGG